MMWVIAVLLSILLSFLFGCGVGLAEIFPRYRDDPFKAAFSRWGNLYWVANGFIALFVFLASWTLYPVELKNLGMDVSTSAGLFQLSLAAGFGAMLLLRTKMFTIRTTGGEEYAVGPEYVLNVLMKTIDVYIDRQRAQLRTELAYEKFAEIPYESLQYHAPVLIEGSRQNIPITEAVEMGKRVGEIVTDELMPAEDKSINIGFLIMDYLGEGFVRNIDIAEHLKGRNVVDMEYEDTLVLIEDGDAPTEDGEVPTKRDNAS